MAGDGQGALSGAVPLLAEDLRHRLRDGRRLGNRHVLSVRDELVGLLRPGRADHRAAHGL